MSKGNRLEFRNFGVFQTRTQAARTAQNPKTLQKIQVSAKRVVRFKMGLVMKQKINAPQAVEEDIAFHHDEINGS